MNKEKIVNDPSPLLKQSVVCCSLSVYMLQNNSLYSVIFLILKIQVGPGIKK